MTPFMDLEPKVPQVLLQLDLSTKLVLNAKDLLKRNLKAWLKPKIKSMLVVPMPGLMIVTQRETHGL